MQNNSSCFTGIITFILQSFLVLLLFVGILLFIESKLAFSKGSVTVNACIIELSQGTKKCGADYIYEYLGRHYLGSGSMVGKCEGKFSVGDIIYVNIAMKYPKKSQWKIPDVKEFLPSSKVDSIKMLLQQQQSD